MKLVLLLVAAVAGSAASSEVAAEVKESAALRHTLRAMVEQGKFCTHTQSDCPICCNNVCCESGERCTNNGKCKKK
jgi:hypothetical protein